MILTHNYSKKFTYHNLKRSEKNTELKMSYCRDGNAFKQWLIYPCDQKFSQRDQKGNLHEYCLDKVVSNERSRPAEYHVLAFLIIAL